MVQGGSGTRPQWTTLLLDIDALKQAQVVLGATTARETVNRALHEVNRQAALGRAAAVVRQGDLGIVQPEDLSGLLRHRG